MGAARLGSGSDSAGRRPLHLQEHVPDVLLTNRPIPVTATVMVTVGCGAPSDRTACQLLPDMPAGVGGHPVSLLTGR